MLFNKILSIISNSTILCLILTIFIISIILTRKNKSNKCNNCIFKKNCLKHNLKNNSKKIGYNRLNEIDKLKKGGQNLKMNEINESIACTVTDCKNHCKNKDYCSLKKIQIQAHKSDPRACENVDCKSFEKEV